MLTTTDHSDLTQIRLSDYDTIVLVEGSEAEVFAEPPRWFPEISVLVVDCGGFQGVGAVYASLAQESVRVQPMVSSASS